MAEQVKHVHQLSHTKVMLRLLHTAVEVKYGKQR